MGRLKYDVVFCSCGRIHTIHRELYYWMAESCGNREILTVCTNCGATYGKRLVMDKWADSEHYYTVESFTITDATINTATHDKELSILFSSGIRVPLKSGCYADSYNGTMYRNRMDHIVRSTVMQTHMEIDRDATTVDVEKLISSVGDDAILRSIAARGSGIDWSGTKYGRKKYP